MTVTKYTERAPKNWPLVTEHGPDCTGPAMVWQAPYQPTAPRLGHCASCGAVAITRQPVAV